MDGKKAIIYAVTNQKGGIGKTTTAVTLAAGLAEAGKKTLLVDADPQCNSSDTLRAEIHDIETLYDILVDGCDALKAVQHKDACDIIPGDPLLAYADAKLPTVGRDNLLRNALKSVRPEYDYIVIDTPPQLGTMLNNALVAADRAIVPVTPERYSLQGLSELSKTIEMVRNNTINENLQIDGLLMVKTDPRRKMAKETMDILPNICEMMHTRCYKTLIRDAEAVRKSQRNRMTIFEYAKDPSADVSLNVVDDYRSFVAEVLEEDK